MVQVTKKLLAPCLRAFRPRRKVTRFTRAGKTKAHWQNCDLFRIVKDFARHPHPFTQTITTGIIERHTGVMSFSAGCLAGNQHSRSLSDLIGNTLIQVKVLILRFTRIPIKSTPYGFKSDGLLASGCICRMGRGPCGRYAAQILQSCTSVSKGSNALMGDVPHERRTNHSGTLIALSS